MNAIPAEGQALDGIMVILWQKTNGFPRIMGLMRRLIFVDVEYEILWPSCWKVIDGIWSLNINHPVFHIKV